MLSCNVGFFCDIMAYNAQVKIMHSNILPKAIHLIIWIYDKLPAVIRFYTSVTFIDCTKGYLQLVMLYFSKQIKLSSAGSIYENKLSSDNT